MLSVCQIPGIKFDSKDSVLQIELNKVFASTLIGAAACRKPSCVTAKHQAGLTTMGSFNA
jgi:hypothetical protein